MSYTYKSAIFIDHGRIAWEITNWGESVVVVPSDIAQVDIDDELAALRSKYDIVELNDDGDIVVSDRPTTNKTDPLQSAGGYAMGGHG